MGNKNRVLTDAPMYESMDEVIGRGLMLAESWKQMPSSKMRGWGDNGMIDFMEGVEDPYRQALVASLLENAKRYYDRLDETTRTMQVGTYEKYVSIAI